MILPNSARCDYSLIRKDLDNEETLGNFRLITLLNEEGEIFANVLAKTLALVMNGLVGEVQICAIPNRSI